MIWITSAANRLIHEVSERLCRDVIFRQFTAAVLGLGLITSLTSHAEERARSAAERIEDSEAVSVFKNHCSDCHSVDAAEGGFAVDLDSMDWESPGTQHDWESALEYLTKGIMPPADADQPSAADRGRLTSWIRQRLLRHQPVGGTSLRRLSAREYANTIRAVFGMNSFELPDSFPPDQTAHGFDNQSAALVVAPSHLEAFANAAASVADEFFPEPSTPITSRKQRVGAEKMVVSYSSACLIDGSMRLASSGKTVQRNATWPSSFEAPASGTYTITIRAHAAGPVDLPTPVLAVSRGQSTQSPLTLLAELEIPVGPAGTHRIEVELDRGDTVFFRYDNGPFVYEDKTEYREFLTDLFKREPALANAWAQIGLPPRGGAGWERLKATMARGDVPTADETALEKTIKEAVSNLVKSGETLVYKYFEQGPYIGIRSLTIEGPTAQRREPAEIRVVSQRRRLLGGFELTDGATSLPPEVLQRTLTELLQQSFRRPLRSGELETYIALAERETKTTGSVFKGFHLAIRTMLLSPSFLYRDMQRDPTDQRFLSDRELANRLAYFLTSAPPDANLVAVANRGKITGQRQLARQAQRILSDDFVVDFVTQWLGIGVVDTLMPDTRLIRKFNAAHRSGMKDEVTETFRHVLRNNLPIRELIAPGFVFTNRSVATDLYEIDPQLVDDTFANKGRQADAVKQVPVDVAGWRGGLLSMPAVMMATANGVDTQPVLRGVWVLENILGTPSPEPPNAVPALTPDTSGASSPKERLALHMDSVSCAVCHREIDPLGFVLENFDAVGRWRDHYVSYIENNKGVPKPVKGNPVDATGTLPDGTPLKDIVDFKQWLAAAPQPFAQCLSEKLLTYATGRRLNYRQRQQVAAIVAAQAANDYKLNDLLIALVQSDVFRAK